MNYRSTIGLRLYLVITWNKNQLIPFIWCLLSDKFNNGISGECLFSPEVRFDMCRCCLLTVPKNCSLPELARGTVAVSYGDLLEHIKTFCGVLSTGMTRLENVRHAITQCAGGSVSETDLQVVSTWHYSVLFGTSILKELTFHSWISLTFYPFSVKSELAVKISKQVGSNDLFECVFRVHRE